MGFWDTLLRGVGIGSATPAPSPVTANGLTLGQLDELLIELNGGRGGYTRYGLNTVAQIRTAFRKCSPLSAIVAQKAFAFTKGTVTVWNPATQKPMRGQFKEWDVLFRQPNPLQSGRQFFHQGYTYQQQYGYCVIDPSYPPGYTDRPYMLRVIPNYAIDWDYSGSEYLGRPRSARFTWNGRMEDLDIDRLIIIRDTASTEIDETTGLPVSRAAVLEAEVSNIVAALDARGEMITDRGAMGILSNAAKDIAGVAPMRHGEKERVQALASKYGITRKQEKLIVTDSALSFTPMTFNTAELGLHPEHVASLKSICNRYGFPFTALAEGFEGKYNNSSNGRRDFQDTTIDPESMDFFEQLSLGLKMYDQNCEAYIDYSGVASVQQSQRERGLGEQAMSQALETQWDLGIVTRNNIRDKLGLEKVAALPDEFDKYKFETASAIAAQEAINTSDGQPEAN
jgi:hypothetical protein